MITIRWSHVIVGLALIIGLFIGSHVQFAPSAALAQTSPAAISVYAMDSAPPVALTVYNNEVYVVRGNNLYIFKTVNNRFVPGYKIPVLIAKSTIEPQSSSTTANYYGNRVPGSPAPPQATALPGRVAQPGAVR